VVDTVEYWTSNKDITGWKRLDKYLYDRFYFLFADRIICISDFLINKVARNKQDAVLKIPSITDFEKFNLNNMIPAVKGKYYLFCGSKAYFEIIDFVISSFEMIEGDDIKLVLVTQKTNELSQRLSSSLKKEMIVLLCDIPYDELVSLYSHSEGLIIPMRENDQDRARFPHKISEYCAAGRPIITNRVGEIYNYFDETNAYLCNSYEIKEFASAMHQITSNPVQAEKIASNSYATGLKHFNYKTYSKALSGLFNN
jgi:glycosyltransferase involved in cell wall biosynthesis